jgi:anhydro-N-acetylmuramic acid kinase
MLVTGGGAYNQFLISRIQHHVAPCEVIVPDQTTLEFKEDLIFGFLGVLRLCNENNVLACVTGAPQDHCAGYVYYPN